MFHRALRMRDDIKFINLKNAKNVMFLSCNRMRPDSLNTKDFVERTLLWLNDLKNVLLFMNI